MRTLLKDLRDCIVESKTISLICQVTLCSNTELLKLDSSLDFLDFLELEYPHLINLVLKHIEILRHLPIEDKAGQARSDLCDRVWEVVVFICDHQLLLPLQEYRLLPSELYGFLYPPHRVFDEYGFLLRHVLENHRDPAHAVFLLQHLTYLPVYDVGHGLLELAIRLLSKEQTQYSVLLALAEVIRRTDPAAVRQVHPSALQQFVNACQRFISRVGGGVGSRKQQQQPDNVRQDPPPDCAVASRQLAPTLHHLQEIGAPKLAMDQTIRRPPVDSSFEMRISGLVGGGKWPELETLFREAVSRDKTLRDVSELAAAIVEALVEADAPTVIDRNFASLVDALTRHRTVQLYPVEKAFLAQLAGTLIVHIDGMEAEKRSKEGDPFQIYALCQEIIFLHPWACTTIAIPCSPSECLSKRLPRHRIAIATIRLLLRRNLGYRAGCIMMLSAKGILAGKLGPCYVDSFHVARWKKKTTRTLFVRDVHFKQDCTTTCTTNFSLEGR